jgi:hypothetical protein
MENKEFTIKVISGKDIVHYLDILTQMRIALFQEYPYLYCGDFDYEKKYLEEYLKEERSILAIALYNDKVVATLTGMPLASESSVIADLKNKLQAQGENPNDYFYYGEVLVQPEYRGKGLYLQMYKTLDQWIQKWGYSFACFLTVLRDENDPRKPKGYKCPDLLAERAGFRKTNTGISFSWPTIQASGEVKDSSNELLMWVKKI